MIPLLLAACGGEAPSPTATRPPNVAVAAARLRYQGNDLLLDDTVVDTARSVTDDPSRVHTPVHDALTARTDKEAGTWIALPGNATWSEARRLLHTAREAGAAPVWIGPPGSDPAAGPLGKAPPPNARLDCTSADVPVTGITERLTLEVHLHDGRRWVTPSLRFLPSTASGPADLLPVRCWAAPTCGILDDPTARAACEAVSTAPAGDVPNRLVLGGPNGCLVPVVRGEAAWTDALGPALTSLGLDASTPTLVLADEPVPLGDVLQVFAGLAAHGIPSPRVGLLAMGSGDRPPTCDNPIRTADDIARARGTWLGQTLARATMETE